MTLKYSFEIVNLQDDIIAIPVGERAEEIKGIVKLNESGREIFELLKEETTEAEIVNRLKAKYEDDSETLFHYVHSMIELLRKIGVLD